MSLSSSLWSSRSTVVNGDDSSSVVSMLIHVAYPRVIHG